MPTSYFTTMTIRCTFTFLFFFLNNIISIGRETEQLGKQHHAHLLVCQALAFFLCRYFDGSFQALPATNGLSS
ncbi:hypothetical protein M758_9G162600 [Ceratodon purpureus]|nr:hypothetical protein M758_9G162600 [Ceratodon purpureus]